MELRPISVKAAMRVVSDWHRHLKAPQGARFALSAWHDGQLVGVAIIGNPVSRITARDQFCCEITRVATNGTRNAGSFLYGKAKHAAQGLGFRKVVTKNLKEESGASLRAAGFVCVGETRGGQWDRENRRREQRAIYEQPKLKWEAYV